MAAQFVRVKLVWLETPLSTGDIESQILIDLKVDEESKEVFGNHPAFGILGSLNQGEMYPFVMRQDGRIDFGNSHDVTERYWETNLRKRAIKKGELITVEDEAGIHTYRIEAVNILGEGEA